MLPTEIIAGLISVVVTSIGFFFMRNKTKVDIEQTKAQTQKILDEAQSLQDKRAVELEKANSEVELNRAQAEKLREEAIQLRKDSARINSEVEVNRVQAEQLREEAERLRDDSAKNSETAKEISQSARELMQVTSYKNYKRAFEEMGRFIRAYFEDDRERKTSLLKIELRLIAVAMTFSWENFIVIEIPSILNEFPESNIDLDVLFLDYKYLKAQKIGKGDIDWITRSQNRIAEVRKFARQCQNYHGRLRFRAKIYRNLPHWHGWLVNHDHLFLGRADWQYENGQPILRVGQNKYRHLDTSNSEGTERIDLFKSWQRYYFEYASDWVCDSSDPSDIE